MMQGVDNVPPLLVLVFGGLHLTHKQVEDLRRLLPHADLDALPLGQVVKSLQHFNSLLDSGHLLEGVLDDVLVHDIQLLHASLEGVVFIVPSGCFDV